MVALPSPTSVAARAWRTADAAASVVVNGVARAVLDRVDVTQFVLDRVDLARIVRSVDLDAIVARVDLDAVIARLDLAGLAEQVIDAVDLPDIIRSSTSTMASEGVVGIRMQSVAADEKLSRLVDRMLLRRNTRVALISPAPGSAQPAAPRPATPHPDDSVDGNR